jgi:hypothetical protein
MAKIFSNARVFPLSKRYISLRNVSNSSATLNCSTLSSEPDFMTADPPQHTKLALVRRKTLKTLGLRLTNKDSNHGKCIKNGLDHRYIVGTENWLRVKWWSHGVTHGSWAKIHHGTKMEATNLPFFPRRWTTMPNAAASQKRSKCAIQAHHGIRN